MNLGYAHTTVRAIAKLAGCNPAVITRYFGGKAGLFTTIAHRAPFSDRAGRSLFDLPFRSWGRVLVSHQIRMAGQTTRDDLYAHQLMLLRSADTVRGVRMLSDFLTREDNLLTPGDLTGPDATLRAMLVHAQLVGLTMLRDIARLPELRDADVDTIARYLGPALQHVLQPERDRRPAPQQTPGIKDGNVSHNSLRLCYDGALDSNRTWQTGHTPVLYAVGVPRALF